MRTMVLKVYWHSEKEPQLSTQDGARDMHTQLGDTSLALARLNPIVPQASERRDARAACDRHRKEYSTPGACVVTWPF